jgi:hypothetical protein
MEFYDDPWDDPTPRLAFTVIPPAPSVPPPAALADPVAPAVAVPSSPAFDSDDDNSDDLMALQLSISSSSSPGSSPPQNFFPFSPAFSPPRGFGAHVETFAMPPPCRNPPPTSPPPARPSEEDPELTPREMMLSPEIRQFVSHRDSLMRLLSDPLFEGVDPSDPCFQQFY